MSKLRRIVIIVDDSDIIQDIYVRAGFKKLHYSSVKTAIERSGLVAVFVRFPSDTEPSLLVEEYPEDIE